MGDLVEKQGPIWDLLVLARLTWTHMEVIHGLIWEKPNIVGLVGQLGPIWNLLNLAGLMWTNRNNRHSWKYIDSLIIYWDYDDGDDDDDVKLLISMDEWWRPVEQHCLISD